MATLREPLKYMDFILNKKDTTKVYLVLSETVHNVWVFREGDEAPIELPKRVINMVYAKVDPKTVKILFGDKDEKNTVTIDGVDPANTAADEQSS